MLVRHVNRKHRPLTTQRKAEKTDAKVSSSLCVFAALREILFVFIRGPFSRTFSSASHLRKSAFICGSAFFFAFIRVHSRFDFLNNPSVLSQISPAIP
jgi:hypothetical protein